MQVTRDLVIAQLKLATKLRIQKLEKLVNSIAGVDVAVGDSYLVGCIAVFSFVNLELIEYAWSKAPKNFPYIPTFLSFREIPVLLKCYRKLKIKPDLLLVDGQGIAHPRYLGIASHFGILLNKPTIGCAKSPLFGDYHLPSEKKGAYEFIKNKQQNIGVVLRTRDNVNPLFISPGNLVDIEDCLKYVLSSTGKYRLPEPIRFAHRMAGKKAKFLNV